MQAIKSLGMGILISAFLFGGLSEVMAEQKTITTTIFITIREEPKGILAKDQNLNNCFDSQNQRNPQSKTQVNEEKIQQGKQEITRYTICEKV